MCVPVRACVFVCALARVHACAYLSLLSACLLALCLSFRRSVCLFVCPSVCTSICLFVLSCPVLSVYLYVCQYVLSVCLDVVLPISLSVRLPVRLPVCLSLSLSLSLSLPCGMSMFSSKRALEPFTMRSDREGMQAIFKILWKTSRHFGSVLLGGRSLLTSLSTKVHTVWRSSGFKVALQALSPTIGEVTPARR